MLDGDNESLVNKNVDGQFGTHEMSEFMCLRALDWMKLLAVMNL